MSDQNKTKGSKKMIFNKIINLNSYIYNIKKSDNSILNFDGFFLFMRSVLLRLWIRIRDVSGFVCCPGKSLF